MMELNIGQFIKSKSGRIYSVTERNLTHMICPIDNTKLLEDYFSDLVTGSVQSVSYNCMECGCEYKNPNDGFNSLKDQALNYLGNLNQKLLQHKKEVSRIEKILEIAKTNSWKLF